MFNKVITALQPSALEVEYVLLVKTTSTYVVRYFSHEVPPFSYPGTQPMWIDGMLIMA